MELVFDYYIAAKPEVVWDILVSKEGTRSTFFGSVIESTFRAGDSLAYVGPGNDGDKTIHVYGKVLEFEPHKVFSYSEHPGPSYHDNHEELETRVTFMLEPVGQCTKLTLVNDRWSADHPSYASSRQHWPMILSGIKTLAETGKKLDLGW